MVSVLTICDSRLLDADQAQCTNASRELHSLLARCTRSEAAMIVRSVTGPDGVEGSKLHANHMTRTLAVMQREEKWKKRMTELGGDAKIPELRSKSALPEMCLQDVKDQMMMRLDEIEQCNENLKTKVISHSSDKAEQSRVAEADSSGPTDVDKGQWEG